MASNIESAKRSFFDSREVVSAIRESERKLFSKFGAYVRQSARQSLGKKRRGGTSAPGSPPFLHRGGGQLKRILFSFDPKTVSVVIGPILFEPASGAPENLEYGGEANIPQVDKKKVVKKIKRAFIRPRPFMNPAFQKNLIGFAENLKDMIKAKG